MLNLLFLANLAATLSLVGVIWMVQIVHYPLFAKVGAAGFAAYEGAHSTLISFVVIPSMLVELATAAAFLLVRPRFITLPEAVVGLALVLAVWGVTFFLSVPQHTVLARGFDAAAHRTLVATNWLRTAGWSLRGILVLWQVSKLLP